MRRINLHIVFELAPDCWHKLGIHMQQQKQTNIHSHYKQRAHKSQAK